jgi:hypothetical protein
MDVKDLLLECLQGNIDIFKLVLSMVQALRDTDVDCAVARAKQNGESQVELFSGMSFFFAYDAGCRCCKDDSCCGPYTLHNEAKRKVETIVGVCSLDLDYAMPQEWYESTYSYCQRHYTMAKEDYLDLVQEELW